jgi:hypothetical protein
MSQAEQTVVIVKDVALFWPKLAKPVDAFGTERYELQIRAPKKRAKELEQFGKIKVQDDGTVSVNLKKKATLADGSPAKKVTVVDKAGDAVNPMIIGNGTKGNVKLMLRDYEIKNAKGAVTKKGTSVMLIAVQITELVEFESKGGVDFDYEGEKKPATVEADDDF